MSEIEKDHKFDFVFVCTGKDCRKEGSKKLLKYYKSLKHLPGSKKRLKVFKIKCMDYCKKAPVIVKRNHLEFYSELPEIRKKDH